MDRGDIGLSRRSVMIGMAAVVPGGGLLGSDASSAENGSTSAGDAAVFDSHFHIIDRRFPLVANDGYLPPYYPLSDYLGAVRPLGVTGGAVVSGSFQGFDQSYIRTVLAELGPGWFGVVQVPQDISDEALIDLTQAGVRALRFNMYRGGRVTDAAGVEEAVTMAARAHAVAGWHAEIYADAATLGPHVDRLTKMAAPLSIDHLGMTQAGLPVLLDLVAGGVKVKATGFGRVKMNVPQVLEAIATRDPSALMFGTDLPSTRAERPFAPTDIDLLRNVLGHDLSRRALWDNARAFYTKRQTG